MLKLNLITSAFLAIACISATADETEQPACLFEKKQCMTDFPNLCATWTRDFRDICIISTTDQIHGIVPNQRSDPEFKTVEVGDRRYRGVLIEGDHGTGMQQRVFLGWDGQVKKTVDLAFVHDFQETEDVPYVQLRLDFSQGQCNAGAELRWRYSVSGAFTACSAVMEWTFCDYDRFPPLFACADSGQHIETAHRDCVGFDRRFESMKPLFEASFKACQKDPDRNQ